MRVGRLGGSMDETVGGLLSVAGTVDDENENCVWLGPEGDGFTPASSSSDTRLGSLGLTNSAAGGKSEALRLNSALEVGSLRVC